MTQPNYPPGMPPQMPPGMPPQGGYPQGGGYAPPPANQGNGMAVASLIFSILGFCLLFIGGLLGILFGIMGLKRANQVGGGGRGLAITGIVLGIITLITSSAIVGTGGLAYFGIKKVVNQYFGFVDAYIKDVSAGNVDAALDKTTGMTRTEVEAQVEQLKSLGAYKSWSFRSSGKTTSNSSSSGTNSSFPGTAHFANGDKDFDVSITADSGGKPKISSMTFH
jgi:hypothetical protein